MLTVAALLGAVYLVYLLYERWDAKRNRAAIPYVVHVNGIRGKTGTSRLIDAGLRAAGLRVFTKTTGNLPFYIDTEGVEHPVARRGPSNIKEQLGMMRRAAREGADVLVLECMAVSPALQRVCEDEMLHSSVGVITNVRYDHILEMGSSLESIAASLAGTVPRGGALFTADAAFAPFFEARAAARGSTCRLVRPPEGETDPLMENAYLAAAVVGAITGEVPDVAILTGGEQRDFGALSRHACTNGAGEAVAFLNLFAVNDPESALRALRAHLSAGDKPLYLFNNRADRPDRAELFAARFFPEAPPGTVWVTGSSRGLARRIFRRAGVTGPRDAKHLEAVIAGAEAGTVIVGLGNIKGPGVRLLNRIEGGERA